MRILFLSQIIPYPPDAGPRVKSWHVLRHLAGLGHEITLASFMRQDEVQHVSALREVCAHVHTVPLGRSRVSDLMSWWRGMWYGQPFLVQRDHCRQMLGIIRSVAGANTFDVIHVDQLSMAQYALPGHQARFDGSGGAHPDLSVGQARGVKPGGSGSRPYVIYDGHNAVWSVVYRMSRNSNPLLRPILNLETRRLKRYEGMVVRTVDHTLTVSEIDRAALMEAVKAEAPSFGKHASEKISVVPIAVDVEQLSRTGRNPASSEILTMGTLHYPPNADGVRWFVREVFPSIRARNPEATLTIVGKNPPQDLLALASNGSGEMTVTGYVRDLGPYVERASVFVVPVLAGGGMRVRILEAFARGLPTVTTTVGLEGIEAVPGEQILVANTASEFSEAVVGLMEDKALQRKLADNGRRLAQEKYDWRSALRALDNVYRRAEAGLDA